MKQYKFSNTSRKYVSKQLSVSVLLTLSLIITTIGLFVQGNMFYGKFLFVLSVIGIIATIIIIKKVRIINDIFYVKIYKDSFELNSNMSLKPKIIYFRNIDKAKFDKKGIRIQEGYKEYRILSAFLENKEVEELWSRFIRYN